MLFESEISPRKQHRSETSAAHAFKPMFRRGFLPLLAVNFDHSICRYSIRSRELEERRVVVVIVARQKIKISGDLGVLDFHRNRTAARRNLMM